MVATIGALRRLRGSRRGVTIVEFGLVAPVLCLLMIGLGDLLYQMYVKELLTGSVQKAARSRPRRSTPRCSP